MSTDNPSTQQGEQGSLGTDSNPPESGQEQQQVQLSPREAAMQAIVDKHEAARDDEQQPPAATEPTPLPDNLPVYQNDAGDYLMRLKVDGVEQEMSLDDVQATMQKHQAADKRLRKVAEAKRQLDTERQQWQEQVSHQQNQPPAGAEPPADALEQAHQIIDTLYDGDPDQAAEALARMMGQNSSTPTALNPQQIEQETRRVIDKMEYDKALKNGFHKFQDEYADVLADPDLREMADRKTLELQALHPDWTPEQVLMESGRVVREKFQPAAPAAPADSRQARKQQLSSMPERQSNAIYTPPASDEPSNNPADVIAQMKKARGQI